MNEPRERIQMIEHSLRCFVFGWLSLIPVIGLGFAAVTLVIALRLRRRFRHAWNPARRYLRLGVALALCGMAGTGWLVSRVVSALV